MSVRAGASLPGPFFITFPIGGPLMGMIGLMLLPLIAMFYLVYGMGWLMYAVTRYLLVPATRGAINVTSIAVDTAVEADRERQATPSTRRGISAADRDMLRKLGM